MKTLKHVLLAALGILWCGCSPPQPATTPGPLTARISEIQEIVETRRPEQADFEAAVNEMVLVVSSQVRTDAQGRARLDLSDGTRVRIGSQTLFTLEAMESRPEGLQTLLELDFGELWITLLGGSLDVETPGGIAAVRGSYMGVQVDQASGQARVTCLEGCCQVRAGEQALELIAGQAVTLPAALPDGGARIESMCAAEVERWLEFNPEAAKILPALTATVGARQTHTPEATSTPGRVQLPPLACLADHTCITYCARLPVPRDCRTFYAGLESQGVDLEAFRSCFNSGGDAQACADGARRP
jgi:hypothetical protein